MRGRDQLFGVRALRSAEPGSEAEGAAEGATFRLERTLALFEFAFPGSARIARRHRPVLFVEGSRNRESGEAPVTSLRLRHSDNVTERNPMPPKKKSTKTKKATTKPKMPARRQPETLRLRSVALSLTATDLQRSIAFYRDVLGFVVGV